MKNKNILILLANKFELFEIERALFFTYLSNKNIDFKTSVLLKKYFKEERKKNPQNNAKIKCILGPKVCNENKKLSGYLTRGSFKSLKKPRQPKVK